MHVAHCAKRAGTPPACLQRAQIFPPPSYHCKCRCRCFAFPIVCQTLLGGGEKESSSVTVSSQMQASVLPSLGSTPDLGAQAVTEDSLWLSAPPPSVRSATPNKALFRERREAIKLLAGFLGTKRWTAQGQSKASLASGSRSGQ